MRTFFLNRNNYRILVLILVITGILGYAIVKQNYMLMLLLVSLASVFLILRSNVLACSILLGILFFGNWVERVGLLPPQVNWGTEIIIVLLFAKAILYKLFRKEKVQVNYIMVVLFYLGVTAVSYLMSSVSTIHLILFLRLMLRFYLLFIAIINLDFNQRSIKLICNFIVFLFLIQIPTAVVKMFIFGQGESAIGTYASQGGIYSTVIPMLAISYLIAFYFFYRPSTWYIVLVFAFIAFGLIGGKRAVIFFVPVLVLFLGIFLQRKSRNIIKYAVICLIFVIITAYASMRFIPSLNPQGRVGGEVDIGHVIDFISGYTMRIHSDGESAGRMATTIQVFNILSKRGFGTFLFGLGPGSYIQTRFESIGQTLKEKGDLPIHYGESGLSWLALQTGYIGAFIYLSLFYFILLECNAYYRQEKRQYWKSLGFGTLGFSFTILFISLVYHPVYNQDLVPAVYFMLAGFVMKLKMNKVLTESEIHREKDD